MNLQISVEKYMKLSEAYNGQVDLAEQRLQEIIAGNRDEMGLVNQAIKDSDEYQKAAQAFSKAFNMLRNFNQSVPNKIKREAAKIRRNQKIKRNQK